MSELVLYEATKAIATSQRGNYQIQCGASSVELKRGVDFDNPIVKTGKNAGKKAVSEMSLFFRESRAIGCKRGQNGFSPKFHFGAVRLNLQ